MITKYDIAINGGVNNFPSLMSCGCCGIREFVRGEERINSRERGGVRYKLRQLRELSMLQYRKNEEKNLLERINLGPVSVPIDDTGKWKNIIPEHAISYYHDEKEKVYYHLHREYVTLDMDGIASVSLCLDCDQSLFPEERNQTSKNKPKKPKFSIASGIDLGDFNRLGLVEPNKFEQCILAKTRKFITIVKVKNNMGERRDHSQQILKGHAITFDHDAPVVTSNVIEGFQALRKSFRVQLICENGEKDYLVQQIMGSSMIMGRPFVIIQWLSVLKRINALYRNDDIPSWNTIESLTVEANKFVVDSMIDCHDEKDLLNELREGDDVAEVRSKVVGTNSSNDVEEEENNGDKV